MHLRGLKNVCQKVLFFDGELWTKRDDFENCGFLRKKTPAYEKMGEIRSPNIKSFDAPLIDAPFEERMKHIANIVKMQKKVIKTFQHPVPHNPLQQQTI